MAEIPISVQVESFGECIASGSLVIRGEKKITIKVSDLTFQIFLKALPTARHLQVVQSLDPIFI